MKNLKQFIFTALIGAGTLLSGTSASATKIFSFNAERADGDTFQIKLQTEDALTTESYGAHTNVAAGLTSPAYTFTGYKITGISGFWFEEFALDMPLPIKSLLPVGSIVENSIYNTPPGLDTSAHSPTDNLFNPNKGFSPPWAGEGGKFSYGGVAFVVDFSSLVNSPQYGSLYSGPLEKDYQLYTDPGTLRYAGCPGSCVGVTEVPEPDTLLLSLGATLVLPWMRSARRRDQTRNEPGIQQSETQTRG